MPHRQGGKITSSHTTVTELGSRVVDFLQKLETVSKISLGPIQNLRGNGGGGIWAVKIIDESHCILVTVAQSGTVQDLRFYTDHQQQAKLALARFIRDNDWDLKFGRLV